MKIFPFQQVRLNGGYLFGKQELNRTVTVPAVYQRFEETGRIRSWDCKYREGDEQQPHYFWDSDIAKWIEGAAYTLQQTPDPALEAVIDRLVEKIQTNQGADGYFNVYFTVVEPDKRFTVRDMHELYCAGHLMEAAVAYAEATGKTALLECMEKYADYIYRVFFIEKSAAFRTPGHEEIELALIRLYRFTGKKNYLELAQYFIDTRGTTDEQNSTPQYQSHLPVRQQTEAVGHAVRALYLYTGMAYLAKETGEAELIQACKTLWEDVTERKMYITGGVGSTKMGEAFTYAYDLPNDTAYTETCAGIGLMLFANGMLALDTHAKYADVTERVLYNGVLSGLSADGSHFFYTNPLEINLSERFDNGQFGKRLLPKTQRPAVFTCSCCPPNINRLLATLGNYIYGQDGDVLYINQFISSTLENESVRCTMRTEYPVSGTVKICADGVPFVAVRIPGWCKSFTASRPYQMKNGYAVMENDGSELTVTFDMTPTAVFANTRVMRDAGRLCIMRGPILYCAEAVDNGTYLHDYIVPSDFRYTEKADEQSGLLRLQIECFKRVNAEEGLYSHTPPKTVPATLQLIPYNFFANRGESDMLIWFFAKQAD